MLHRSSRSAAGLGEVTSLLFGVMMKELWEGLLLLLIFLVVLHALEQVLLDAGFVCELFGAVGLGLPLVGQWMKQLWMQMGLMARGFFGLLVDIMGCF